MEPTTLPLIRRWSAEDDNQLIYLRETKCFSFSEIGKANGRGKGACISRYQRLKGIRKGRRYIPTGKYNG